ncbi:MAG: hypothetical protein WCO93_11365 [bacterium]
MKEKESIVDCPEQQLILYVEKENGSYGPVQTGSYISANYLDDYFFKRRNLELDLRKRVKAGEVSLVYYYMILVDLSLSELAARAGMSKSKVKRHLDPKYYGNCSLKEITRYAGVFNVPVSNMLQIVLVKIDDHYESLFILEGKTKGVSVSQTATANPYCTATKIEDYGK